MAVQFQLLYKLAYKYVARRLQVGSTFWGKFWEIVSHTYKSVPIFAKPTDGFPFYHHYPMFLL